MYTSETLFVVRHISLRGKMGLKVKQKLIQIMSQEYKMKAVPKIQVSTHLTYKTYLHITYLCITYLQITYLHITYLLITYLQITYLHMSNWCLAYASSCDQTLCCYISDKDTRGGFVADLVKLMKHMQPYGQKIFYTICRITTIHIYKVVYILAAALITGEVRLLIG